jgi:hypothetical protein
MDRDDIGGSDIGGDYIDGDDDELLFADEADDGDEPGDGSPLGGSAVSAGAKARPWKIMIVDDDRGSCRIRSH